MSINTDELRLIIKTLRDNSLDNNSEYIKGFMDALDLVESVGITPLEEDELTLFQEIQEDVMNGINKLNQ